MKTAILTLACGLFVLTGCVKQEYGDDGSSMPRLKKEAVAARRMKKHAKKRTYSDSSVQPYHLDLFGSAARGDLPGVQDALARGAQVDSRNPAGATALLLASASGSLPVIQTLVAAGADVNAADNNGRTPLSAATAGGYAEIARTLRAAGARDGAGAPQAAAGGGAQWWNSGEAAPQAKAAPSPAPEPEPAEETEPAPDPGAAH